MNITAKKYSRSADRLEDSRDRLAFGPKNRLFCSLQGTLKRVIFIFATNQFSKSQRGKSLIVLFAKRLRKSNQVSDEEFFRHFIGFETEQRDIAANPLITLFERLKKHKKNSIRKTGPQSEEPLNISSDDSDEKCLICLDNFNRQITPELTSFACAHAFHQLCYRRLYFSQQKIDTINCLQCVSRNLSQQEIESFLLPNDIKTLFENTLDSRSSRVLQKCLSSECDFLFEDPQPGLCQACPCCGQSYCLECKIVWEDRHNCVEYKDRRDNSDRVAIILAMGPNMRECQNCKLVFEIDQTRRRYVRCFCGFRNDFRDYLMSSLN